MVYILPVLYAFLVPAFVTGNTQNSIVRVFYLLICSWEGGQPPPPSFPKSFSYACVYTYMCTHTNMHNGCSALPPSNISRYATGGLLQATATELAAPVHCLHNISVVADILTSITTVINVIISENRRFGFNGGIGSLPMKGPFPLLRYPRSGHSGHW